MALIDIDRHILLEIILLREKMNIASAEFKDQWEKMVAVREKSELIVFAQKDIDSPELPKLKEQLCQAMKTGSTKIAVLDDCMSRMAALLNHMVSDVIEADTKKGRETYGDINSISCNSVHC